MRQAFIDAINANPDDRTMQLIYADWLDQHDEQRGMAWRVLIEAGKRPHLDRYGRRWRWYYCIEVGSCSVEDVLPGTRIMVAACPLRDCKSYFEAMDMLAAEWVRHHLEQVYPLELQRDVRAEQEAMATAIRVGLAGCLPPSVICHSPAMPSE